MIDGKKWQPDFEFFGSSLLPDQIYGTAHNAFITHVVLSQYEDLWCFHCLKDENQCAFGV
jgi:hypothetical protein